MYYVQYIDSNGKARCGSDGSAFIRLKTVGGVIRRARKSAPSWAVSATLASCSEETKYGDLSIIGNVTI